MAYQMRPQPPVYREPVDVLPLWRKFALYSLLRGEDRLNLQALAMLGGELLLAARFWRLRPHRHQSPLQPFRRLPLHRSLLPHLGRWVAMQEE
jgi:hypothetical protein